MTPLEKYEADGHAALKRVYNLKPDFAPPAEKTPLAALLEAEECPSCPHCKNPIELPNELEAWAIRVETMQQLFAWFGQDGHWPHLVARNVFAVATALHLDPWSQFSLRELGKLLGDSHGAEHWRIEKFVNLMRRNLRSWKVPGQKSLESRAAYSECQQENTNRKRQNRPRHRRRKVKEQKIK